MELDIGHQVVKVRRRSVLKKTRVNHLPSVGPQPQLDVQIGQVNTEDVLPPFLHRRLIVVHRTPKVVRLDHGSTDLARNHRVRVASEFERLSIPCDGELCAVVNVGECKICCSCLLVFGC